MGAGAQKDIDRFLKNKEFTTRVMNSVDSQSGNNMMNVLQSSGCSSRDRQHGGDSAEEGVSSGFRASQQLGSLLPGQEQGGERVRNRMCALCVGALPK